MHYYKIEIKTFKHIGYDVYCKNLLQLTWDNVLKYAVRDGDLIDVNASFAKSVHEITPEEYFNHMWE